jgi:hypothetical protein
MGIDTTIPYGVVPQGGLVLDTFFCGLSGQASRGSVLARALCLRTHMNIVATST